MPAAVSKTDALIVLKTILLTFADHVCDDSHDGQRCDASCRWKTAIKQRQNKSWDEMDATPTLYDNQHEGLPGGCWSIFWEGDTPPEWAASELLAENIREATDGRVHVETINNCILGIYPS